MAESRQSSDGGVGGRMEDGGVKIEERGWKK
jgi:hypothetical protein